MIDWLFKKKKKRNSDVNGCNHACYKRILNPAVKIYAPICRKGRNAQQQQTQVVRAVGARPCCSVTFLIEISILGFFFCPTKVNGMTMQILFRGQVSAGEARRTVFLNPPPASLCILQSRGDWLQHFFSFFSPPTVKPQPAVRLNMFPEQSGASGMEVVVLQKYVRGFFPRCVVAILRSFVN